MSFQQDKRVIKPSKWSERYARWFSTRVLSTSPMFRYIVVFLLAIFWSIIYLVLFGVMVDFNILLLLSSAVGLVVYLVYLTILKNRFEFSVPDQSFSQLVDSAIEKTGTGRKASVWLRLDDEPYITSSYNAVFEAVIVSTRMMELILAMPESGEAMLAFHLLRMPKRKSVMDLIAGVLVFTSTSIFITLITASLATIYLGSMYFIMFASTFSIIYVFPIFLVLLLRGAFWKHESAFERTEEIYKIHPQVAKDEVLSAQKMDEELAKSTRWSVRSWEERKRSSRRMSISFFSIIVLYFVVPVALSMLFLSPFYTPWQFYVAIQLLPFVAGCLVFFTIKRWDRNCMDEAYTSVTDSHEQIWFD